MHVLGIDPSLRRTGIALVSFNKKIRPGQHISVISYRVVQTDTMDDLLEVISRVYHCVERYSDSYVKYIETPYLSKNPQSLMEQSGLFYGLQVLLHYNYGGFSGKTTSVNPNQVKTFLGIPYKERGNKDLVVKAVREMVGDAQFLEKKTKKDREAICDAVGIACTGAFLSQ